MNNKDNNTDTNISGDNNDMILPDSKNNDIKNVGLDAINPNKSPLPKKSVKPLTELEIQVLHNYYDNCYNMSKAYKDAINKPDMNSVTAINLFKAIAKKPQARAYITELRNELTFKANINKEQVLNEFKTWAFADASELIGLTEKQVKELPSEVRRAIQSYKVTNKTVKGRDGNETTIQTIDCKLVDKVNSLKEAAKIIGAYEIDNKQKSNILDLTSLPMDVQKGLLDALTKKQG